MKKLLTGVFAATLLTSGLGVAFDHGQVRAEEPSKASEDAAGDAWEKAAKEAETPKVETPKADTSKKLVIDEEEKAKEDAYKDKAEAKYKEELKKQETNKKAPAKAPAKAPVKKVLPKTSAVR